MSVKLNQDLFVTTHTCREHLKFASIGMGWIRLAAEQGGTVAQTNLGVLRECQKEGAMVSLGSGARGCRGAMFKNLAH